MYYSYTTHGHFRLCDGLIRRCLLFLTGEGRRPVPAISCTGKLMRSQRMR